MTEDPIYHPGQSPYNFVYNNPLKYTDPSGADVLLIRWGYAGSGHEEVWVGNNTSGYISFGFDPTAGGGIISAISGQTVNGYIQERRVASYSPFASWIPLFGYDLYGRIVQGPDVDAQFLNNVRTLVPLWQNYNAYDNNCQDFAQTAFNLALQMQKTRR